MYNDDVKSLLSRADRLFSERKPLLTRYQSIADVFYPVRADFTADHTLGEDFAAHMSTSYTAVKHDELSNIVGNILRPDDKRWLMARTKNYDRLGADEKDYLERVTVVMSNAFNDPASGFVAAGAQADADVTAFGNAVLSCQINWKVPSVLWQCWHLRDVVWEYDYDGTLKFVARRWFTSPVEDVVKLFPKTAPDRMKRDAEREPSRKARIKHVVVKSDYYGGSSKKWRGKKYISLFIDCESKTVLEEKGLNNSYYAIPAWRRLSGTQYAFSPCTTLAIPDARMLQDMALTMIEAGQKAVDPPILARGEVIDNDIEGFAGGVTFIDSEYDARLGPALEPWRTASSALPYGHDVMNDVKAAINEAFYLNKIGLPPIGGGMSPLEVQQRVQEYIMQALPLFKPLEGSYNRQICDLQFDVLMEAGGFGSVRDIPEGLAGRDIDFEFENPLRSALDKAKGQMYLQALGIVAQAAQADGAIAGILNNKAAIRDVLDSSGIPRAWIRSEDDIAEMEELASDEARIREIMSQIKEGAEVAQSVGEAGRALGELDNA
ncbi:MAG: hypothetical protein CUN56_00560 [Phototrophicales bacterium]|nr:MAG: hypothetical protein CUN56_00560 [Phototrophicales bacterium]